MLGVFWRNEVARERLRIEILPRITVVDAVLKLPRCRADEILWQLAAARNVQETLTLRRGPLSHTRSLCTAAMVNGLRLGRSACSLQSLRSRSSITFRCVQSREGATAVVGRTTNRDIHTTHQCLRSTKSLLLPAVPLFFATEPLLVMFSRVGYRHAEHSEHLASRGQALSMRLGSGE